MRTLIPTLTLAAIVVLAAGCGGSKKSDSTTAAQTAQGTPIPIVMKDFSLTPSAITIPKAGTYTLTAVNNGGTAHAIAIEGQGIDEDGPTVDPGGTSTVTVDITKPGEYEIYCPVGSHKSLGMEGTLTLAGSSPASNSYGYGSQTGEGYGR